MDKYHYPSTFDNNATPPCPKCRARSIITTAEYVTRPGYTGTWVLPTWRCPTRICDNHNGWQGSENP